MAFLANNLSLFLVLTVLSSLQIHARDSQFFNKISTNNNGHEKETKEVTPNKEKEPNFIPENENGYGVYGQESGQLSPFTTTPMNNLPNSKYLPKNYDPVAYVTVPRDNLNNNNDDNNNNNNYNQYYNGDSTYGNVNDNKNNNYNQYYSGDNTYDNDDDNNQYYTGDSTYDNNNNKQPPIPQWYSDCYNNNNYPYKYVRDPHENSREFVNSYADKELSNYNNFVKYEINEEEFQAEGDMP
ncbi:protein E6-like [Nicotiana tomentosiformis]|uniref:protein E6-like n=1 Tax=Nicotiana tomentosiformis TaxID=4098 RepID=UPI00051C9476|nr:probable WRKY transcription factor protein 1 [Nicotiana tomentosiformis]